MQHEIIDCFKKKEDQKLLGRRMKKEINTYLNLDNEQENLPKEFYTTECGEVFRLNVYIDDLQ